MARIIAIDYGLKRTGLAVTDPLQIIASPLETVPTSGLIDFLKKYFLDHDVDTIVVGMPLDTRGEDTHATKDVRTLIGRLRAAFEGKSIVQQDERYTSAMARRALIDGGMPKGKRRNKGNVDRVSAALILQSYMARK